MRKVDKKIREIEKKGKHAKMYDFYLRMNEKYRGILAKVDGMEDSKHALESLIEKSQKLKEIAIQESLRKLSKKFSEMFKVFIHDSDTSIKLIRESEVEKMEDGDLEVNTVEWDQEKSVKKKSLVTQNNRFTLGEHAYTGLSIRVGLKSSEYLQQIKDLSGGEKSIVAISLLFALNSLTPSMIYLLDEVDSALDKVYREGLCRLLEKMTKEAKLQFFITSFRPEMIEAVDSKFMVSYKNTQSSLQACTLDEAYEVVQQVETDEEI